MGGFDKIEFAPVQKNNLSTVKQNISVKQNSFAKMDFGKQENPKIDMAGKRKVKVKKPFSRKKIIIPLAIILIVVLLLVGVSIPVYATYKSGLKTYREAQLILAAVKKQNVAVASDEIAKTQKDLQETHKNLHYLLPLKYIPVVNWYYNDADHLLNAGAYALDSSKIVIDSLAPYADVLGLKGKGSFAMGSAEDRIKTAVMTIGKITPKIDTLSQSLTLVKKEIDNVNPDHYPALIFGKKIQSQLTNLRDITDQGTTFIDQARPLVKLLPSLLGEQSEKKYLILFQNDKELRATGGFITAYAIFRIDKGVIKLDKSEDIYTLDNSIPNKEKAPAPILKYLPNVYTFNLRDSNINPDFIESMKTFRSMYETAGDRTDVDGIIALDTSVLVSTIKILDDQVQAGGLTFTSKNDPRCDCPQVIYELEDNISRPVNYIKTERKGLLGQLLSAIMSKALSSSPKLYWGPLMQSIVTQTNQKHVLFDLYDQDAQKGIEALNAAGRIKNYDGDYLHINETNFSGAKVNIFMQETVDNSYDVKSDGTITKTVTINYKNPYPPSDCNLERGGLCLNAEYRDWFRIYVPKGSELIESKGSQVKMSTYDELGKTVFDGFTTVRPKGIGTLTITYKLPFKLTNGSPLPVLIQKQPGTNDNQYTTIVNGKSQKPFPLLIDTELKLKI